MMRNIASLALVATLVTPGATLAQQGWDGSFASANLGLVLDPGDSATGSIGIGFDREFGRFVGGVELDVARTDVIGNGTVIDNTYRAKLRAGVPVGNTLVYGLGGLAHATGDFGGETGYLLGIGAEHRLNGGPISLGGELIHHEFNDFNGGGDLRVQTLTARVSYRF
ncbi:outer membrane beta-barrel protein [Aquicoccus sp. SCR17]|nr:outer membrane beta-barrel protein [Carideicomes alvinocaridis]